MVRVSLSRRSKPRTLSFSLVQSTNKRREPLSDRLGNLDLDECRTFSCKCTVACHSQRAVSMLAVETRH